MSGKYEQVRNYYVYGMWTLEMVKNAVRRKWITEEEYREITEETYE